MRYAAQCAIRKFSVSAFANAKTKTILFLSLFLWKSQLLSATAPNGGNVLSLLRVIEGKLLAK